MSSLICFRCAGFCDVIAGFAILRSSLGVVILVGAPEGDHREGVLSIPAVGAVSILEDLKI